MDNFEALGLSAPLLRALEKHDFTIPTQIQAGTIPPLLQGHDLIGLAETGTGKTAAFLLPMLERLQASTVPLASGAPRGLILAPTRELASQIGDALNTLSGFLHLRSTIVFGGAPMHKQLVKLKAGVDILIATPGRLMDHVRRGSVVFDAVEIFILDEADRMLDMGFVNDVKAISKALPAEHQTVLFSATINKSVEGLTKVLLNDPVRVDIARKISVSENVSHCVMHMEVADKKTLLKKILRDQKDGQTIIFTKTKRGADALSRTLVKAGLKSDAIHGDRNQRQRQRTLARFRSGIIDILIATDVAARGIDVPGVNRVINYDLPLEPESYVHRVGRTGRNGASGTALSFCPPTDAPLLWDIERLLKQKIAVDGDHDFHVTPPAQGSKSKKRKSRSRSAAGPRPPHSKARRHKPQQDADSDVKRDGKRKGTGKPSRTGTMANKEGRPAAPAKRKKPHRKGTAKPGQPQKAKKRSASRSRQAAGSKT